MKIENINVADLIPYDNNPRDNSAAIEPVANSIKEFGFLVPIVIDKSNVIVAGHTRLKAAELLGMKKCPCIRASDLDDEQIKAFRIADNSVSEAAKWDFDKLDIELSDIQLDMNSFNLNIDMDFNIDEDYNSTIEFQNTENEPLEVEDDGYYGDERERTYKNYNLGIAAGLEHTDDFWQMPIIYNNEFIPEDLVGFNYALSSKNKEVGIHFYVDDYQFERVWNNPKRYIDTFMEYDCMLTPDFSLYTDMDMPTKIWNIYRSRLIGAYYQSLGINVIPTISWAEPETFNFCFKGIPEGSIVSISTIGVKQKEENFNIWQAGCREMIKQIKPSVILVYGGKVDFDYGDIEIRYFDNHVTEKWEKE